jgi:hypothetical protein
VDPEQPRLPSSRLSRLRHYRNLHCTEPRLGRLLRDFAFGPIREVFGVIMGDGALARVPVRSLAPGKVA